MSNAKALVLQPGEGEVIRVVTDTVRVLADGSATGGRLLIFEEITEPGHGPPLHRHGVDDEYFFVTEGEFTFVIEGRRVVAPKGAFVVAPNGTRHTFTNSGITTGRMLIVTTPPGLEGPFRETAAMRELTPDTLTAAFAKFNLSIEGPPLSAGR
jgi:mannose-6-phosphate isomerase-like protein (cupin superfamily)